MKLLRLATLYLDPKPENYSDWIMESDRVTIRTKSIGKSTPVEKGMRSLIEAEIELSEFPKIDGEGFLMIPEDERKECEMAIETAGNIISVFARCKRTISSPHPPVALIPEDKETRERLDSTEGIRYRPQGLRGLHYEINPDEKLISGLMDRREGLALLAEAFSHSNASGKYREYIRYFELAFALASSQLEKKLSQFLKSGNLGYDRPEIKDWLSLRDPATHGDKKKSSNFVLEADIRPFIDRIEQAALDVLFNKEEWHNSSKERRNLWKPTSATTSVSGDMYIVQGTALKMTNQVLDGFGVYPWDFSATIEKLPDDWWCRLEQAKDDKSNNSVHENALIN